MFLKCISVFPAPVLYLSAAFKCSLHTTTNTERAMVIDLETNDSLESVRLMNQTKSLQNKRRAVWIRQTRSVNRFRYSDSQLILLNRESFYRSRVRFETNRLFCGLHLFLWFWSILFSFIKLSRSNGPNILCYHVV